MVRKQNTANDKQMTLNVDKQYNDEKRIVMFVNEKRDQENNGPIMRGQFVLNGVKYYVSLWDGIDQNKKTYWYGQVRDSREPVNTNGKIFPTSK